jgi:hypothetical protein
VNHFVQSVDRDPVSPAKVSHRRVTTRHADLNHCLIVFVEEQGGRATEDHAPEIESWQALDSEPKVAGDNLGFRSAVRHAPLPLANSSQRETGLGPANGQVHSGRGPGSGLANSEVRVREQVRGDIPTGISHPPGQTGRQAAPKVAHEPEELTVAPLGPFGEKEREVLAGTKQVRTGVPGTIQRFANHLHRFDG